MTAAVRLLGFLFALAGMTALGAESRPAIQLTLASAELAEGDALRVWVKAEGLSGQRVVLADGATLLAAGELNLRGEAELVVRNLAPGRRRIMARLPQRMELRSDVVAVQVTGEQGRGNRQRMDVDGALATAAFDSDLDGRMDLLVATREELLLLPGAFPTTTTAVAGMSPARGSGTGGQFAFTFTDTNGANDLGVVNILVNDWLDGRRACYLAYARGNNTLYLMNDYGTGLLPGLALSGTGSLGNSQCTVNGVGSSVASSGNTLTLTLNMAFGAGFAGNRVFYLAARDVNELNNTGWRATGSWSVQ
ncbi:MAG: hypothetical protein Q8N47_23085 [Bryobacterales bacterium]|nr:hypothetical protein [Bryobacterales bacterium]